MFDRSGDGSRIFRNLFGKRDNIAGRSSGTEQPKASLIARHSPFKSREKNLSIQVAIALGNQEHDDSGCGKI